MTLVSGTLFGFLERFAARLRFPQLFWLTAILFLLDVFIPDLIPFADEILLGLATLVLGSWKRKRDEGKPAGDAATPKGRVIDIPPDG